MIKKIKNLYVNNTEILIGTIIFAFFLIILFLSPISSDDWGNYLIGQRGLRGWIGNAIGMYFDWEGRIVSRVLINGFTYNKWLWNIFNALCMAALYYFTIRLIKPKKKVLFSILLILGLLLIGNTIFTQSYLWVAGNLTYFTPMVLLVIYFWLMNEYIKNQKFNKWFYYLFAYSISFIVPMFVEHMGAVMILTNIIVLLYLIIKNKKIDKFILISLILSILTFVAMLLSPGTAFRSKYDSPTFQELSIFGKIITNIPNFITNTVSRNNFVLSILPISFIYLVWNIAKNKIIRLTSILFNIIPYIAIILNIINWWMFKNINIFKDNYLIELISKLNFIYETNIYMIIYWIIYLLIWTLLLIIKFKDNYTILFVYFIGLAANGVMFMSPIWGGRTTLFTVYMLIITILLVLDDMLSKLGNNKIKIIKNLSIASLILVSTVYGILYVNIYRQNNNRSIDIKKQLSENKTIVEIERMPDYALWNINPEGEFHIRTFKEYYHIPKDVDIVLKQTPYKYFIFYQR